VSPEIRLHERIGHQPGIRGRDAGRAVHGGNEIDERLRVIARRHLAYLSFPMVSRRQFIVTGLAAAAGTSLA
jgi:hypothetical protein